MRKKLFGLALALALVFPAVVQAAKVNLSGNLPDGGTIKMVSKHNAKTHKYTVVNLKILNAPIHCTRGNYRFGADTSGFVFKVDKQGNFGATLLPDPNDPTPDNHLKIAGTLTHHGTKASGTYRLKGDNASTSGGSQDGCNTGTVSWTAQAQ